MKNVGPCYECKCEMWIPDALYEAARHDSKIFFCCAYGHSQHYPKSPRRSAEDALRLERDRLAQRVAQRDDEIKHQRELRYGVERRLNATKGVVTRIKNRVGHGVCPCCSRTFQDLQRHMKSKHSDYAKSPVLEAAE